MTTELKLDTKKPNYSQQILQKYPIHTHKTRLTTPLTCTKVTCTP